MLWHKNTVSVRARGFSINPTTLAFLIFDFYASTRYEIHSFEARASSTNAHKNHTHTNLPRYDKQMKVGTINRENRLLFEYFHIRMVEQLL